MEDMRLVLLSVYLLGTSLIRTLSNQQIGGLEQLNFDHEQLAVLTITLLTISLLTITVLTITVLTITVLTILTIIIFLP